MRNCGYLVDCAWARADGPVRGAHAYIQSQDDPSLVFDGEGDRTGAGGGRRCVAARDAEGLNRHASDCNMGCIDH